MSKTMIKPFQFRYFKGNPDRSNVSVDQLASGKFLLGYELISQVGIQTSPGVRFKINADRDTDGWIEMNDTGIYELDLREKGNITSIIFNQGDINSGKSIEKNVGNNQDKLEANFFILIDIIYSIDNDGKKVVSSSGNPQDSENKIPDIDIVSGGDSDGEEQMR